MRQPFLRYLATEIPDVEEVVHALFDLAAKDGPRGEGIRTGEVASLARQYDAAAARPS